MKKYILIIAVILTHHAYSQSVFGYWYGNTNVKAGYSTNNYLVELILQPEKGYVKGILNYFFKNTYQSIQVKGNYNASTRELNLYNIPIPYHASLTGMEVYCTMNLRATLRVAKGGSDLIGAFVSLPQYQYTCVDINFNLKLNADASKTDSVLNAIKEYKETYQVWKPSIEDTEVVATVIPRKVINYVTEQEYTKRENVVTQEIEVESNKLKVDVYDNGEIDGDIISLFYNQQIILSSQKLTHRSIHIDLSLDTTKTYNEVTLFAENLGLIPPNTALVVINDGKNRYEVRLSSSLEKNATLRIKRKKTF